MNLPTFGALDHGTAMSRSLRGGNVRVFLARIGRIRELLDRFEAHTLDVVADVGGPLP
jgi:hypothetical protein